MRIEYDFQDIREFTRICYNEYPDEFGGMVITDTIDVLVCRPGENELVVLGSYNIGGDPEVLDRVRTTIEKWHNKLVTQGYASLDDFGDEFDLKLD